MSLQYSARWKNKFRILFLDFGHRNGQFQDKTIYFNFLKALASHTISILLSIELYEI